LQEKHQVELKNLNEMYSDQLKQFEYNFNLIQEENEKLQTELDEIKDKLRKSNISSFDEELAQLKEVNQELSNKIKSLDESNLKYKTKLKKLIVANKQHQQQSLKEGLLMIEQERSTSSTPLSHQHSPSQHDQENEQITVEDTFKMITNKNNEVSIQTEIQSNHLEAQSEKINQLEAQIYELEQKIEAYKERTNIENDVTSAISDKELLLKQKISDMQIDIDNLREENVFLTSRLETDQNTAKQNIDNKEAQVIQSGQADAKQSVVSINTKFNDWGNNWDDVEFTKEVSTVSLAGSTLESVNNMQNMTSMSDNLNNVSTQVLFTSDSRVSLTETKEQVKENHLLERITELERKLSESASTIECLNENIRSLEIYYKEINEKELVKMRTDYESRLRSAERDGKLETRTSSVLSSDSSVCMDQIDSKTTSDESETPSSLKAHVEKLEQQNLKLKAKLKKLMLNSAQQNVAAKEPSERSSNATPVSSVLHFAETSTQTEDSRSINDDEKSSSSSADHAEVVDCHRRIASLEAEVVELKEALTNLEESKKVELVRLQQEIDQLKQESSQATQNHQLQIEKLAGDYNVYLNQERQLAVTQMSQLYENYENQLNLLRQKPSNENSTSTEDFPYHSNELSSKQQIIEQLQQELFELKSLSENHRLNYENQINSLTLSLKEKESMLDELNRKAIAKLSISMNEGQSENISFDESLFSSSSCLKSQSNDLDSNAIVNESSETNLKSKCTYLESQLKYCHEKCEKVVAKLNQLKKQNESLNTKIKSIKSMMYT
jgi:chromosome segregation ATPase